MWPCATSKTSLMGAEDLGTPMAALWKRVRMSEIRLSRRWVTCAGDLIRSSCQSISRIDHQRTVKAGDSLSPRAAVAPYIPYW